MATTVTVALIMCIYIANRETLNREDMTTKKIYYGHAWLHKLPVMTVTLFNRRGTKSFSHLIILDNNY